VLSPLPFSTQAGELVCRRPDAHRALFAIAAQMVGTVDAAYNKLERACQCAALKIGVTRPRKDDKYETV